MVRTRRPLIPVLALLLLGCSSMPLVSGSLPADSSLLAVDVHFPVSFGRDPSLVGVFLARGPIHAGLAELPVWIPASFVKGSRAYLLDPQPGTYSLVAVRAYHAPLRSPESHPLAPGVTGTVVVGDDVGEVVLLPSELIQRSRTTVGPGRVAFMGALEIVRGQRVNADTTFDDVLEARIAESIRPGASSEAGIGSLFTMTWTADPEQSSLRDGPGELEAFVANARADLGVSPWAEVVASSPGAARQARSAVPAPRAVAPPVAPAPTRVAPGAEAAVPSSSPIAMAPDRATPSPAPMPDATTPSGPRATAVAPSSPSRAPAVPPSAPRSASATAALVPIPPAPPPEPIAPPSVQPFPGVPLESPLAQVAAGMDAEDVHELLGDPDERSRHLGAKAWIPFYTGADAQQIDWVYRGEGRVVFSMDLQTGVLEVLDVRYDPETLP